MKRCPECRRDYYDDTLLYCLDDGNALLEGPASTDEPETAILPSDAASEAETRAQAHTTEKTAALPAIAAEVSGSDSFDKRLLLAPLALAFIVLGGFFGYRYFAPVSKQIGSIAVMPFENRSGAGTDTEYLSDGLTDSLIFRFSQLSNLKVSPTSSVMRYKGTAKDLADIAKELDVDAVLAGRLTQIGDDLSISVQLIDARSKKLVWAEQYDRKMADLLATQREIAGTLAQKLQFKLGGDENAVRNKFTDSNEAYQLYLKGEYEWNKHTPEDVHKAIDYFQQALAIDPNYALAYCGLADSYGVLGNSYLSPHDAFPKAESFAGRALALDNTLERAHMSMGGLKLYYEWNWTEADTEMKQARTLDPGNDAGFEVDGDILETSGRIDEALAVRKHALERDPLSPMYNMTLGATLYFARRYDEAIAQLEKAITLEPRFLESYEYLGAAYEQKGMYEQAIAANQRGISLAEDHAYLIAALGHTFGSAHRRDEALKRLGDLKEMSKQRYVSPYLFALVYSGIGDIDQTFVWLERAYSDRSASLLWLNLEPSFDPVRSDARFGDLLRRIRNRH